MQYVRNKPLESQSLSELYVKLQRLELSGISPQDGFNTLAQEDSVLASSARLMSEGVQKGQTISQVGARVGWFRGLDLSLIRAAEQTGVLGEVYGSLSHWHKEKAKQQRAFRSRLRTPIISLLFVFLLQPLPEFVSGSMGLFEYIFWFMAKVAGLVLLMQVFLGLPRWLSGQSSDGFMVRQFYFIQLSFPKIGRLYIRRQVCDFMYALALLLKAGIPILQALPRASDVIINEQLKNELMQVGDHLIQGKSLTDALALVKTVSSHNLAMVRVGEAAGALDKSIMDFVKIEYEDLLLEERSFFKFVSSAITLVISLWIANQILLSYGV